MSTFLAFLECKFNHYFCYALALQLKDDSNLKGLLVGCDDDSQAKSIVPVVIPRGLPVDLDTVLRKLANAESGTAHHHTWLNPAEVEKVQQRYQTEYSNSDPALDTAIAAMHEPMVRDCRLIVWIN